MENSFTLSQVICFYLRDYSPANYIQIWWQMRRIGRNEHHSEIQKTLDFLVAQELVESRVEDGLVFYKLLT